MRAIAVECKWIERGNDHRVVERQLRCGFGTVHADGAHRGGLAQGDGKPGAVHHHVPRRGRQGQGGHELRAVDVDQVQRTGVLVGHRGVDVRTNPAQRQAGRRRGDGRRVQGEGRRRDRRSRNRDVQRLFFVGRSSRAVHEPEDADQQSRAEQARAHAGSSPGPAGV